MKLNQREKGIVHPLNIPKNRPRWNTSMIIMMAMADERKKKPKLNYINQADYPFSYTQHVSQSKLTKWASYVNAYATVYSSDSVWYVFRFISDIVIIIIICIFLFVFSILFSILLFSFHFSFRSSRTPNQSEPSAFQVPRSWFHSKHHKHIKYV